MSKLKDNIINEIIEIEGGYVDDRNDSGGKTRYGITIGTARKYGYKGSMKNLSRDTAYNIYSKKYWDRMKLDDIETLSPTIAKEMADTGVNMGIGRAGEFLQRSLNVLNNRGKYYPDLKVDSQVGSNTIKSLRSFLKKRGSAGEIVLYKMLNSLQGAFYVELAERRVKDESFVYGWFKNRVD